MRKLCRKIGRFAGVLALAVILAAVSLDGAFAKKEESKPSFFRSTEVQSRNLKPFKKWNSALKRYIKERRGKAGSCKSTKLNKCHYAALKKFLLGLKGESKVTQITAVNNYMNRARYTVDKANWGKKDYWATPGEFMERFGDCEDYAIAKFVSLRMLGFRSQQIRVVAVKDLNLKVGHAVLVVFEGGKTYLLDNQIKTLVETKKVRHYKPVFSINDKAWWRHRG